MVSLVDKNTTALFEADFRRADGFEDVLSRIDDLLTFWEDENLDPTSEDCELLDKYAHRARAQRMAAKVGEDEASHLASLPENNPAHTINEKQRSGRKEYLEDQKVRIAEGHEILPQVTKVTFSKTAVENTLALLIGTVRNPGALGQKVSNIKDLVRRGKRAVGMLDKMVERTTDGKYRIESSNGGMYEIIDGQCNCPDNDAPTVILGDGTRVKACKHGVLWLAIMRANKLAVTGSLVAQPTEEVEEVSIKQGIQIVAGNVLAAAESLIHEAEGVPEVAPRESTPRKTPRNAVAWAQVVTKMRAEFPKGTLVMLWRPANEIGYDPKERKVISHNQVEDYGVRAKAAGFVPRFFEV